MFDSSAIAISRPEIVRRGLRLNYFTIGYNTLEAVVSLGAGLVAGSVALVGFGIDSVIEVMASGAAQWRLRADLEPIQRARVERLTRRIVGASFIALAVYVAADSMAALWSREAPGRSVLGCVVLMLSVLVMPILARAKRRVARALDSHALEAEATQTAVCAYLSVIALAGVGLNVLAGWWWADPIAALGMVPIIAKEGIDGFRDHTACGDCCR